MNIKYWYVSHFYISRIWFLDFLRNTIEMGNSQYCLLMAIDYRICFLYNGD